MKDKSKKSTYSTTFGVDPKCIESGRKNGIEKPVYEPRVRTHFIRD